MKKLHIFMFGNLLFQYIFLQHFAIVHDELSKERISQASKSTAEEKECYFEIQIRSLAVNCRHIKDTIKVADTIKTAATKTNHKTLSREDEG